MNDVELERKRRRQPSRARYQAIGAVAPASGRSDRREVPSSGRESACCSQCFPAYRSWEVLHPGSIEDDPPFLGLIESRNAGTTWRPISLRGQVDFHVLEAQGETVYGFGSDWDTREARFLRSDDRGRTWKRLAAPEGLLGLAIDPHDPRVSVALGEERGWVSRDGGATWRPLAVPGGMVTWTRDLGLIAVDLEGVIRRAGEPIGGWTEVGRLPGTPAAVEGIEEELLAATHESQVLSSRDGGKTWRDLLSG